MTYLSEEESRKLVRQIEARGRIIQKMLKESGLEGITGYELVHKDK